MALYAKKGYVSGTSEKLTLEMTIYDLAATTIDYTLAAQFAISEAPNEIMGLDKQLIPQFVERAGHIWKFQINYEGESQIDNKPPVPVPTGGQQRKSSTVAKAQKRSTFLEPIGVFGTTGGNLIANYPGLKYKLGASSLDSHHFKPVEVVLEPFHETHDRNYYPPNATVTEAYLKQIEDIVSRGCFNEAEFDGRPIGSLQVVRFSAQPRSRDDWELTFGFAYVPERTNVEVGEGIIIPKIRGCDFHWTKDELTYNPGLAILQTKTALGIVGQVWDLAPFADFALPAVP